MSVWFNYQAVLQIIIAGLVLGAGLPALFSLAVRLNAEGAGVAEHGGTVAKGNPLVVALSWVILSIVGRFERRAFAHASTAGD